MNVEKNIEVDYVARVEGEASIIVHLDHAPDIKLKIFEPPRFFEGFLVGRKYDEIGDIVSRICGICPVSHMTTAIQAVEKAMGIEVTAQTKILRDIMSISQIVASHLVHLYVLVMPDYYGYPGIVDMKDKFTRQILNLMEMKTVMNKLTGLIGGRALHPVTHLPGGFTSIPSNDEFESVLEDLKKIRPKADQVVKDIWQFNVPDFHTETEYLALAEEGQYAFNHGRIVSTKGLDIDVEDYYQAFEEFQIDYAFTKKSKLKEHDCFMVGALARINNKFDQMQEHTKKIVNEIGFKIPNNNPFYNNLAQSLEIVEGIERCIQLIESTKFEDQDINVTIKAGQGGSITEAPRGLLFHWYKINVKGLVEKANIVTPTSHNFQNIENDLKKLVEENQEKSRDEIRFLCEKLVRAYDPCFSCSVH